MVRPDPEVTESAAPGAPYAPIIMSSASEVERVTEGLVPLAPVLTDGNPVCESNGDAVLAPPIPNMTPVA